MRLTNIKPTSNLIGPVSHHLVPLGGVDLNVGIVHETINADAGAEADGKAEAKGHRIRRRIGEPV